MLQLLPHWKSEMAKDLCDRSSCCSCCHTGSLKWQRTCVTGVHAAAVARATNCPAGQEWWKTYKTSIHVATVAKVTDLSWKSGMVRGTCILESHSNCCHGHWPCLEGWSEPAFWSSCSNCCHGYWPVLEGWSEPASWSSCSNCCHGYWPVLEGWSKPTSGFHVATVAMVTDLAWKGEVNLHPGFHVATVAMVTDLSWKGEANLHPGVHVAAVAMVTDLLWKPAMMKKVSTTKFQWQLLPGPLTCAGSLEWWRGLAWQNSCSSCCQGYACQCSQARTKGSAGSQTPEWHPTPRCAGWDLSPAPPLSCLSVNIKYITLINLNSNKLYSYCASPRILKKKIQ